ncbi:MAG: hypothetical protein A3D95_08160 [Betaproteobacteria bacterium RIFCSPHIGHO2_12_FULL_69_13]|nr:MAG: hypothetical protein A3D95_08160 [Betaproteobacteria bacterium RIFCSPHIGHO2_12_FULL_69_13]OGA67466.1 MAG: hypothetical protein A3G83_17805 [Betaproteobacteria bacterium RIFCSPLOWO2_12_FULL_68_20]
MPLAPIDKADLLSRLAEGHAAGVTVVTPNRRLAAELAREFDERQIASGLAVWEDADILPFGAFVARLYEDALYSERAGELPMLLTPAQERHLWEETIAASEAGGALASPGEAAARAMQAWRLAHAWRIAGALGKFAAGDDARAFAAWAREYEKRAGANIDSARLPDLAATLDAKKPKLLVAYAFDILPPQTQEFFEACGKTGIEVRRCDPPLTEGKAVRAAFKSAREELEEAAGWARARLEAGAKRIGVVVPDLQRRRSEAVRVFSRAMRPGWNLPGAKREPMPFNLSLGEPLAAYPLVRAALGILELAAREVDFALASGLVRSPFLGGAESEMAQRARLDAALREKLDARIPLAKLIGFTEACPQLRRRLEALFACAKDLQREHTPHEWGRHFTALLEAAGFPGERALDSDEFQARAKLNELLGELARLERVAGKMSFHQALAKLRRLCEETLFQPETPDAPIQVLGVLESAGLRFDCLWVSGMTEEAWPLPARPNPFLPIALQKKAGIPEASAETSLALDKRLTEGWLGAAKEVVFSFSRMEKDRELAPSPLLFAFPSISTAPQGAVETLRRPHYRDLIFEVRRLESVADGAAPALAGGKARGGSRVLTDQSACPFRAFARHRLGARALEAPEAGPDALDRGRLLHELMKEIWTELKGSSALSGDLSPIIERSAARAVKELGLEGRFAALERERLAKLARDWLEVERKRGKFEVAALEERRTLAIGTLELSGRIDRMDRLPDGTHALIDYKTSRNLTPRQWMGERPEDPQLPLYALSAKENVTAVAFAKLRAGDMRYMGYSREEGALPGLTRYDSWETLLAGWKKELESLAQGFSSGDARVDPRDGLKTCRHCDLHTLCRVHERLSALADEEGEGE